MHAISKGSLCLSAIECLPLRAAELLWGAGGVELLNWKRKLSIESAMWGHIARYMTLILLHTASLNGDLRRQKRSSKLHI